MKMPSKYVNLDEYSENRNGGPSETENSIPKAELSLQVLRQGDGHVRSVVTNIRYGSQSQLAICPFCNERVSTTIESKATNATHLIALRLLCLCWCAYCFRCAYKTKHTCPNCGAFLGSYRE